VLYLCDILAPKEARVQFASIKWFPSGLPLTSIIEK